METIVKVRKMDSQNVEKVGHGMNQEHKEKSYLKEVIKFDIG
jgi:hypothetical protein